jgi:DNA-binding IclR family transcriptional regulator
MNHVAPRERMRAPPDRELARAVEISKAPAISRAAAVLRLLGDSDVPLGVHAIARDLGLVPSTCFHVLKALVAEDLLAFDADTKRYALGPGVLTLARQWQRRNRFSVQVQPHLDRLGQTFHVTGVGLHVVDLTDVIVVAISQAASTIQLSTQIGSRFPAMASAAGRCVAAFSGLSLDELEPRFRAVPWEDPPTFDQWKAQVRETQMRGYAVDEGNFTVGLTVYAAPVWESPGKLRHVLLAIGLSSALQRTDVDAMLEQLLGTAAELSNLG